MYVLSVSLASKPGQFVRKNKRMKSKIKLKVKEADSLSSRALVQTNQNKSAK